MKDTYRDALNDVEHLLALLRQDWADMTARPSSTSSVPSWWEGR